MRRAMAVFAVVTVLVVAGVSLSAPTVGTAAQYDLGVEGSVDVPTRTFSFDGSTYRVSAIARADPGDTRTVQVLAPANTTYEVVIYNSDRAIVDSAPGNGTTSVEFTFSGYTAGTYVIAVFQDGIRTVHPLVIRGYSASSSAPSRVAPDESFTVTAEVSKLRGDDLDHVEIVIANANRELVRNATRQSDGRYTVTVAAGAVPEGRYRVYAAVRGTETIGNRKVLIGLSDPSTLEVAEPTPTTTSPPPTTTSPPPTTTVPTTTTTTTPTTTAPPTTTTRTPTETTTTASPTTRRTTSAANDGSTTTGGSSTTDDAVITPRSTTAGTGTTGGSLPLPGFGFHTVVLAGVLVVVLLGLRRRR